MKAAINAGLPRKMVKLCRAASRVDEFIDGHFASASYHASTTRVCANQAFNDVAVAIEKM